MENARRDQFASLRAQIREAINQSGGLQAACERQLALGCAAADMRERWRQAGGLQRLAQ